jgi:hypothetical protein
MRRVARHDYDRQVGEEIWVWRLVRRVIIIKPEFP